MKCPCKGERKNRSAWGWGQTRESKILYQVRRIFQGEGPLLHNTHPREANKEKNDLVGRIQCLSLRKRTTQRAE